MFNLSYKKLPITIMTFIVFVYLLFFLPLQNISVKKVNFIETTKKSKNYILKVPTQTNFLFKINL